ncbi:gp076 [Rhodococcus phage ReqiDocB7]|uniref:gp076 n=1 Tax=Rhodococcus phage ReqiDocB7 TaxID=691966 RepID=UPI0001CDD865|nr:gp076 [Rhodococcus phage ReqiDocB7]ADD80862.1 gp076 [Rhodococcus phage ReqiDocB7]
MAARGPKIRHVDARMNSRNWLRKFMKDNPIVTVTVRLPSFPQGDLNKLRIEAEDMARKRAVREYGDRYGKIEWDVVAWLITHTTTEVIAVLYVEEN